LENNEKLRFYLHTLGCKVNQYESQAIRESMLDAGFEESSSRESADVYVLNTCTVTENADRESRYMIGVFGRANPQAKIVVTGCYAEKDAQEIASLGGVSHIVKNADKNRIADLLKNSPTARRGPAGSGPVFRAAITGFKGHTKAFVKVQDGCENSCSYCKVPIVRGPLKSRPLDEIIGEVRGLVNNGFKEIVLTGICLGAWGREYCLPETAAGFGLSNASLIDVLSALDDVAGDFRIRLSSIEPKYVTDRMLDYINGNKRICRHLHIPLQSGDDEILRRMNRPYTSGAYMSLIRKARAAIGGLAVTTDVLIGFPGESEANFNNTINFIRELSPARTHIFTFSRRPGTAAYDMAGAVDPNTAKGRHRRLDGPALNASYLFSRSFLGKTLNVLVESAREGESGFLTGYTDNYIKVIFPGPDELMGRIVPVRITRTDPATTMGERAGA